MTRTEPDLADAHEALLALVQRGEQAELVELLHELAPSVRSLVVSRLTDADRRSLLLLLEPELAAELLAPLPEVQTVESLEELPAEQAARILEELPSDERADVLTELDEDQAEAILSELEPGEADELRSLCTYPDGVAGGLMVTELVRVPESSTVRQVVDDLHDNAERYDSYDVQYAYVVSPGGELRGVLPLRRLLFSGPRRPVRDLMVREPTSVPDSLPLQELAAAFDQHRLFGLPVVDAEGRLLGVVRKGALEEAQTEASDDSLRKTLGIIGGEELRSMPLRVRSGRRLSWLSLNVVLNVAAASVIALHRETLESAIALAVFLPIISDMSGCSGSQAVGVTIRELTMGLVRPFELGRVLVKELSVGLVNGAALGLLVGLIAWLYQGELWLAVVVGGALALNTVVAVSIGGLVPLVLRRLGFDPALASGPILTTATDMCGFLMTLSFAALALRLVA